MFFGVISARRLSVTCMRRQRLRKAIATARLAALCPTMCLSSSWTISLGVMDMGRSSCRSGFSPTRIVGLKCDLQFLDREVPVCVDTNIRRDSQRFLHYGAGVELGILRQRARRGLCIRAAGADRHDVVFRLDDVTVA